MGSTQLKFIEALMEPLSQLLLLLAGIATVGVLGGVGFFIQDYNRKRNELRGIDQQVWGLESGAQDVKLLQRDDLLEFTMFQHYLGYQEDWHTQNVLQEIHPHCKSFIFDYVPVPAILGGRLKGVLINFTNASFPSFAISSDRRTIQGYRSTHIYQKLNISVGVQNSPHDLVVLGALKDQPEVEKFILENQQIYEIFEHPLWQSLYVRDNFVAAYYLIHGMDDEDQQDEQFYSVDEKIARLFWDGTSSEVDPAPGGSTMDDPAIEINLLKDEEQND